MIQFFLKFGTFLGDRIRSFSGGGGTLPETNSSPMKIPIFPGKYR